MSKPETTLFMLMSVDGKISTGSIDDRDVDKDFIKINGVNNGLQQYYAIEQTTDLFSLNSGRVLAKVGANNPHINVSKTQVSFIVIDNKPHLNEIGVNYLLEKSKMLYIVTTNEKHPAYNRISSNNLRIIKYQKEIDFIDLFKKMKVEHGINKMTIQTGGTLNTILLRKKLIDKISVVIAPVVIGGKDTSTLFDGKSLETYKELYDIKALVLTDIKKLNDSYLQLKYNVINETKING